MGAVIFCATVGCESELVGAPEDLSTVTQPWTCDECKTPGVGAPKRAYARPALTEISPPHFPTPALAPPAFFQPFEVCPARAPDGTLDGPQCTRAVGHEGPHENKGGNTLGGWVWSDRGFIDWKPPEKAGYGPTCEARFALPVQVCKLAPGHVGDHDACVRGSEEVKRLDLLDDRIEVLHWARSRPEVMAALQMWKDATKSDLSGILVEDWEGFKAATKASMADCSCTFMQHAPDSKLYRRIPAEGCVVHCAGAPAVPTLLGEHEPPPATSRSGQVLAHSHEDVDGACHPSCPRYVGSGC